MRSKGSSVKPRRPLPSIILLWKQAYPQDFTARNNLGVAYVLMGQLEKALEVGQEVLQIWPDSPYSYVNLGWYYLLLGRVAEAKALFEQAITRNFDTELNREGLYTVAFFEGDVGAMRRHAAWAAGRPEQSSMLFQQANTEAFYGKLNNARELFRQSFDAAEHQRLKESAASTTAWEALTEACFGNLREGREKAARAMGLARTRDILGDGATTLALSGDLSGAEALARELAQRFPEDTRINAIYRPCLRGAVELQRGNAEKAIEALKPPMPYERAYRLVTYLRGQACLKAGAPKEAALQFQAILDDRGLWFNAPWIALARLGLGRAWALAGDTTKSRRAYQDFLALWKDADPDIPILREARAEYAKLK